MMQMLVMMATIGIIMMAVVAVMDITLESAPAVVSPIMVMNL